MAPGLHRLGHDALAVGGAGDIAEDDLAGAALFGDHRLGALHPLLLRVHQRDLRAVAGEEDAGGAAIADAVGAGAGAGHDRDLAGQAAIRC